MNRTLAVVSALGAGLVTVVFTGSAMAQAAAAPAPNAAAELALQPPQAIPAKIALIFFEQAVGSTNEGQKASADLAKEFDPLKAKLSSEAAEVDTLRKKISSAPATMSDADRADLQRQEDTKEKQFTLDQQDAEASVHSKMQDIYTKLAPKVMAVAKSYCQQNGYTIMLDAGAEQSNIMWISPNIDITKAVIDAYNASSGVAAPPPPAPSAAKPRSPTTPPASRPAAPKSAPTNN